MTWAHCGAHYRATRGRPGGRAEVLQRVAGTGGRVGLQRGLLQQRIHLGQRLRRRRAGVGGGRRRPTLDCRRLAGVDQYGLILAQERHRTSYDIDLRLAHQGVATSATPAALFWLPFWLPFFDGDGQGRSPDG